MKQRHDNEHTNHHPENDDCPVCNWIGAALDSIHDKDLLAELDQVTSNALDARRAVVFLLALDNASRSKGTSIGSVDDCISILATIRMRRMKIGKFPFISEKNKKKGKK